MFKSNTFASMFFLASTLMLSSSLCGQERGAVLVSANQATADISLTDISTGKRIADIAEGIPAGHEVAVSKDDRYAYVPIYGDSSVGEPGTDGDRIVVVDLGSHKIVGQIDLRAGVRPHGIALNPADGFLYVTAELQQSVLIVDPLRRKIIGAIPTGQAQTHMIVLSHDGHFGYTSNVGPGTVSVLDLKARKLIKIIPVSSGGIQRISITPDDKTVFTADQGKPQLAAIDTSTNSVKHWIPLPSLAYGTAVTTNGESLLVTLPKLNELGVVDLLQNKIVRTFPVSKRPHTVVLTPNNRIAYVACIDSGVSVVNLATDTVSGPILVGDHSDGIALAHLGRR